MFTPIHLLPQYDPEKERRYSERWNTDRGLVVKDKILDLIRKGGGEDFLLRYLTRHELNVLSDHWDLKGIELFEEQIDFPVDIDNFEGIDFSYASLYHCKFNNAVFGSVGFSFTRFYNCELVNCFFGYTNFYGANLEGTKFINFDFAENNTITNCDLRGVVFENYFMPSNLFFDCRFDEKTVVHQLALKPIASKKNLKLDESELMT